MSLAAALALPAGAAGPRGLAKKAGRVKAHLAELEAQEGDLLAALERLELQERTESAALEAAEKRVADSEKALAFVRGEAARTRATLKKRRAALAPRLAARYRLGRTGYLPLLLSAGSMDELLRRRRLLGRIIRRDLEAIAEVRRLEKMLAEQEAALAKGTADLETLRASAAARLEAARAARREREAALAAVRGEKALSRRALASLDRARKKLVGLVRRLPRKGPAPGATGFAALRGRLPLPTAGAIEMGFGTRTDPRYDTVTVHKGVDIRAPKGTKVKAVAAGRVAHAGWLRGYGNLVILDHGGGYYTLMAHLDRMNVKKGAQVAAGEVVGLVGDTGSLKGAHLYFEIREGGRAVDPQAWFADR